MSRKLIAIDIDDTITESRNAVRKVVNDRMKVNLPIEAYDAPGDYWGYYERVWASHDLHGIDALDIYDVLHKDQSMVPLLPGAEFAIHELLNSYDIVLITSRDAMWEEYTRRWLSEHFSDVAPDIYFCRSHREDGADTKGQIANRLGAEWLIDDNVEHCQSALDAGVTPILFGSYGWHHKKPAAMLNLQDWPAVLKYFQAL